MPCGAVHQVASFSLPQTRDVKIVFLIFDSRKQKFNFFFDYRLSADVRNWFRQASSTAVRRQHADVSLVVPSAPRPRDSLYSCVSSSSGAFLQQPPFGTYKLWCAKQSPGVSWINGCCDDVQVLISYGKKKQTSNGIPPPTYYVVVQLISRANACRYHLRVNWTD